MKITFFILTSRKLHKTLNIPCFMVYFSSFCTVWWIEVQIDAENVILKQEAENPAENNH
jgi:hypothetical protein